MSQFTLQLIKLSIVVINERRYTCDFKQHIELVENLKKNCENASSTSNRRQEHRQGT